MDLLRRPRPVPAALVTLAAVAAVVAVAAPALGGASVSTLVAGSSLDVGNGMARTDGGDILLTHVLRDEISRIDPDGGAPTTWKAAGGPQEVLIPDDIALGPSGDAFVNEFEIGNVVRIDEETRRTRRIGHVHDNGTPTPNGIAYHPSGRLFVSPLAFDGATRSGIWEVDPQGVRPPERVTEATILAPEGFDVGPDGDLYVPAFYSGKVWRVDVDGAGFQGGTTDPVLVAEGLGHPVALTFLPNGTFAIADTGTGEVVGVHPDTGTQWTIAELPRPGQDNLQVADGDLFVSSFIHGGLARIDLDTGTVTYRNRSKLGTPNDLTTDGKGNLLVANALSLSRVTPAGDVSEAFTFGVDLELGPATAVDRGPDGRIWWAELVGSLKRWDPSTGSVTTLAPTAGPADLAVEGDLVLVVEQGAGTVARYESGALEPVWTGLRDPSGVAVGDGPGPARAAYVSEAGTGLVHRLLLVGGHAVARDVVPTTLDHPQGIQVLPDGHLLVVEAGAGTLTHVDPASGATSTVATGLDTQAREGVIRAGGAVEFTAGLELANGGTTAYVTDDDAAIQKVTLPGMH